jgi:hypothetical protein
MCLTATRLLIETLQAPARVERFDAADWDLVLRQAQRARLLARLARAVEAAVGLKDLPPRVAERLTAALRVGQLQERAVRWEVNRIERALAPLDLPIVLLKGAAYVMAGLPPAQGRLCSDVDILVPQANLAAVEQALLAHGWEAVNLDEYDQYYYRTWMHELPPLRHRNRQTLIDVHHTILPCTGRLHPSPEKLFTLAQPLAGTRFQVLSPADMVLHSAAHAFQDGELADALRDLFDLDDLLRHFALQPGFWEQLVERANELGLGRPLYYALAYTRQLLRTPVPRHVSEASQRWRPAWPVPGVMDALVTRALLPEHPDQARTGISWARRMLYLRSHWLRMPPLLLARHLLRKSLRRGHRPDPA